MREGSSFRVYYSIHLISQEPSVIQVLRYRYKGEIGWGVHSDGVIIRLNGFNGLSLPEFLERDGLDVAGKASSSGEMLSLQEAEILSPVTAPCSIVCQGLNYRDHVIEAGGAPVEDGFNLFFSKASSSLSGPSGKVVRPAGVELLDYELELGIVIKKRIEHPARIESSQLSDFVAGVVMGNDVSARDVQIPEEQWFHGKSYRGFCPVGPYLCVLAAAEWRRLDELVLELRVNGEVRQRAKVGQMIHPVHKTLTELSAFMDLSPGDLVLTGTPSGVALQVKSSLLVKLAKAFLPAAKLRRKLVDTQSKSGRFLRPGDKITSSIRSEDGAIDLGVQRLEVMDSK